MIALVLVIGIAVALSVAGWIPLVRDAVRADGVLPAPARAAGPVVDDVAPEAVAV